MRASAAAYPMIARYLLVILSFALALVIAPVLAQPATPVTDANAVQVDCDAGESLTDAIAANGGDTSYDVSGTCSERVSIANDGITIDGGGTGVIDAASPDGDGPVIHVLSARHVTLRGLTVQNGQHGILVENLSTITVDNVVSRNNESHGIEVIQSHANINDLSSHDNGRVGLIVNRNSEIRVTDSSLESNGISGLVVFSSAIVRLEEANVVSDNGAQGITLGLGGMIFAIGSQLSIENNGAEGLSLLQNGNAQFLGGDLSVRENGGDGISLDLASSLALGFGDFEVPGQVLVEGNDGNGVSVLGDSQLAIDPIMPATVQGNGGHGLYVDGSGARVSGSTFENNEESEIELVFGANATAEDMSVDEIGCSEDALLRGSVSCP